MESTDDRWIPITKIYHAIIMCEMSTLIDHVEHIRVGMENTKTYFGQQR